MLGLLPHRPEQTLSALDLGCGTGVLSYLLLSHFPNIRVTAYDLAENMLATCKKNLTGYSDRVTLKQGNFGTDSFGEGYDVVLSGFAIHHLDNPGKADLYKRIYREDSFLTGISFWGQLLKLRNSITGYGGSL